MTLLHETNLTEVLINEGNTDYILVTFGNLGTRANGSDFYGRTLAQNNNITCIGFAPRRPHWFPYEDMRACLPKIRSLLQGRPVITYGESMGGYAALRYASMLGAEVVIAGSPQYSIDPRDVPNDPRYWSLYNEALHSDNMRIQGDDTTKPWITRRYILFDPLQADDAYNLSLIKTAVPTRSFQLPYTDHYSNRVIGSSKAFMAFVDLALKGQDEDIRFLLRSLRKQNSSYRIFLGRHCSVRGHYRTAWALISSGKQLGAPKDEVQAAIADHWLCQGDLVQAAEAAGQVLDLLPDQAAAHARLGNILRKQGEFSKAAKLLSNAIRLAPRRVQHHFDLWATLQSAGQLDKALSEAVQSEPQFADDPYYLRNLAALYRDNRDLRQAEHRLRQAIAIAPHVPDFHQELSDILQRGGRLNDAISASIHAVELFPENIHLRFRLAYLLKAGGRDQEVPRYLDLDGVENRLREAIALESRLQDYYELCSLLQQKGRITEALEVAEVAASRYPSDVYLKTRFAELLNANGRLSEAVLLLRGIAEQFPEHPGIWEQLAECLAQKTDTLEEGITVLRNRLQTGAQNYRTTILMGHLLSRKGAVAASKQYFLAALEMMPNNEDAMISVANTLAQLGEANAIPKIYARYRQSGGSNLRVAKRIGSIMLSNGDIATAEEAFRSALETAPDDVEAAAGLEAVEGMRSRLIITGNETINNSDYGKNQDGRLSPYDQAQKQQKESRMPSQSLSAEPISSPSGVDRLQVIDVGAMGGLNPKWQPYVELITPVLFEPNPFEAAALRANLPQANVIEKALAAVDGPKNLVVTENPTCTSLRTPNHEFLSNYGGQAHFRVKEKQEINCARYDSLHKSGLVSDPDIIKLDVQGYEYEVLLGFGETLQHCIGIELESHFYPLYSDQRLLHDIITLLNPFGFILRKIDMNKMDHFEGDLVEVDAYFTKTRQIVQTYNRSQRDKFDIFTKVCGLNPYRVHYPSK